MDQEILKDSLMLLLVDQNSGIGDLLGQKPDGSMLNGYQVDAMGRIATAKGVRNWRLFQNPNKLSIMVRTLLYLGTMIFPHCSF